ncbi:MAG: SBBP repeat-containing protein [Pseudomonadota bacterium]
MVTQSRKSYFTLLLGLIVISIVWMIGSNGLLPRAPDLAIHTQGAGLPFIPNNGQISHPDVAFHTSSFYGDTFVTQSGEITYRINSKPPGNDWVLKEQLVGASQANPKGISESKTSIHFFGLIKDWNRDANLTSYKSIGWNDVYPGIDLTLQLNRNSIEKVLTVSPGGNPEKIRWRLSGAQSLTVDDAGELVATTALGPVRFSRPIAYQEIDSIHHSVGVQYVVDGELYGFDLGEHDPAHTLVIDPLLASTYIGSTDADADTESVRILYDAAADEILSTGITHGLDFPTTAGAYDTTHDTNGNEDIFIVRMSSDLSTVIAASFLGGAGADAVRDMAFDPSGNIILGGDTGSPDFPVTAGTVKTTFSNLRDTFVAVMSADLSTLIVSTYFGDTGAECVGSGAEYASAVTADSSGNIYLAGNTTSHTLPVPANAYQTEISTGFAGFPCGHDAFIVKMDPSLSSVLAATYYGTGGNDNLTESVVGIALDSSNNVYIAGWAPHATLPVTVTGGDFSGGTNDTYIARFDSNLTSLTHARYLGGTGQDVAKAITNDANGNLYITGHTRSTDFPTTAGAWLQAIPPSTPQGSALGTAVRLDNNLQIQSATYLYRTLPTSLIFDPVTPGGEVVLVGESSSDFPYPADAYDPIDDNISPLKLFIGRFDPALSDLFAATTLHGQCKLNCDIAADSTGNLYVIGQAITPIGRDAIDLTSSSYDTSYNGGGTDLFISKLSANLDGTGVLQATPASHDFGTVNVPATPTTVYPSTDIVLTNPGTGWLTVTATVLSGSDPGQFTIDANTCTGTSSQLRPQDILPNLNHSCMVTVTFRPFTTQTANWSARLQITSTDPVTPVLSVTLTGRTNNTTGTGGGTTGGGTTGGGTTGGGTTGGGGGGCTVGQTTHFDPSFYLLLVFSITGLLYRRRKGERKRGRIHF